MLGYCHKADCTYAHSRDERRGKAPTPNQNIDVNTVTKNLPHNVSSGKQMRFLAFYVLPNPTALGRPWNSEVGNEEPRRTVKIVPTNCFSRQSTVGTNGPASPQSFSIETSRSSAWAYIQSSDDEFATSNIGTQGIDGLFALKDQGDDEEVVGTGTLLLKNSFLEFGLSGGPQELAQGYSGMPRAQSAPCLHNV